MRRVHRITIILGGFFLAILIWKTGPVALYEHFRALGAWLFAMIFMNGLGKLFHALGWRRCLTGLCRSTPFHLVYSIRMVGFSINHLTPSATVGGDVIMGTLLSRIHPGADGAASALIGKLSHTLAQLLFALMGTVIIVLEMNLSFGVWVGAISGSFLLGASLFCFVIVQKRGTLGSIMRRFLEHRRSGRFLKNVSHHVTQIDDRLKRYYADRPRDFPLSVFWNFLGLACGIATTWFFFLGVTENPSFATSAAVCFLATWFELITFALPSNIGVLEGTSIVALKLAGYPAALGLSYGIALRVGQLFWSAVGLVLYAYVLRVLRRTTKWPEFAR